MGGLYFWLHTRVLAMNVQVRSAVLSGLISCGTALVALLTNAQSFGDITGPAYVVAVLGSIVVSLKDLQSSARDPQA
jgi:hypothetical protein